MSFFRGPDESDSSKESSKEEEEELQVSLHDISQNSVEELNDTAEVIEPDVTTESLSLTNTISNGEDGVPPNMDDTKDMMMASMLEELSKYKAAEMMNDTSPGNETRYDKNSSEVQEFAKTLFARSSSVLNEGGLMTTESASERRSSLRKQFLAGLQKLSYQKELEQSRRESAERGRPETIGETSTALMHRTSQQPTAFQGTAEAQVQQLTWEMDNMNIFPPPSKELHLAPLAPRLHMHSHYHSTFEERGILGRGGFGRVYHTYNILDQREYAVKKIPLSPRLSRRYHDGGHKELAHILREVQALARLDHCNVVRYHATWLEAPAEPVKSLTRSQTIPLRSYRGQMLLEDKPAQSSDEADRGRVVSHSLAKTFTDPFGGPTGEGVVIPRIRQIVSATSKEHSASNNDYNSFDPFARSSHDNDHSKPLWSAQPSRNVSVSAPNETAPLFTDGHSGHAYSLISDHDDPTVYVLHVQMSMYPLTLAEYLLPASSPRRHSPTTSPRHCFHLVPAVRLILGILCGLQYINSQGYIHRDIKPSNIFLSVLEFASPLALSAEQGYADIGSCPSCSHSRLRFVNPRIGDFGLVAELARATDSTDRNSGGSDGAKAVGTEYYRPPRHEHSAEAVDESIDVFALGVILLELLWGCATRMERMALLQGAQLGRVPEKFRDKLNAEGHSESVISHVEACVAGMIHPDPKRRWRCDMVKESIEGILSMVSDQITREIPD